MDKEVVQYDLTGLLCEEVLLFTPPLCSSWTSLHVHRFGTDDKIRGDPDSESFYRTKEERDSALGICLEREGLHVPGDGYEDYLRKFDLLGLRMSTIKWIIKTHERFKLSLTSAFDAVNYLDRFISANRSKKWKLWMIELLSIACLSIAAKCNDISFPPLFKIQMENLEHAFEPKTVQRMEMTVMKALDWRVSCVTAYSFVDLLTWFHPSNYPSLASRMADLLLSTLSDPVFMEFKPSVLATSALQCSLEELVPSKANAYLLDAITLLPPTHMGEIERCHKLMEGRLVDPTYSFLHCRPTFSPTSPMAAVPTQRIEIFDSFIDCNFFLDSSIILAKKRKNVQQGDDDHDHQEEDHYFTPKKEFRRRLEQMV